MHNCWITIAECERCNDMYMKAINSFGKVSDIKYRNADG